MIIDSAAYANSDHTAAFLEPGSVAAYEVETPELWAEMLAQVVPAPFVVPAPTKRAVNQEMFRRIGLIGANGEDAATNTTIREYLIFKQIENIKYAGPDLTTQEKNQWDIKWLELQEIVPIVQAAAVLKQTDPIPDDYANDSHWPPVPT